MKIKKHLVAAALAVGLAGSATAMGPPADDAPHAQMGYVVAKHFLRATEGPAQVASQAAFGAAGGIVGTKVGAKIGAAIGVAVGGPVGFVTGVAIGAL